MSDLRKASFLAILSAMILAAALAGCNYERRIEVPKSTFDLMLGHGSPDTNFISRMEFVSAQLQREMMQNSNNWASMRTILVQIEQRFAALEPKPVPPPAPQVQQVIPPLQSAPVIPGIEKEKP